MGPPRVHSIRKTSLGKAIRSIRRRLRLGQIPFNIALTGRPHAGEISRWEAGLLIPSLEMLARLLRLAETPEERDAILEALRVRRIDELLIDLRASGLIEAGGHQTSIHPAQLECNAGSRTVPAPMVGPGASAPVPHGSGCTVDSHLGSPCLTILADPAPVRVGAGSAPPDGEAA